MSDLLAEAVKSYPPAIGDGVRTIQYGTATLATGTKTVTGVRLSSSSVILVAYNTEAGTPGRLSAPSASRDTSLGQFVISSSSGSDTSTVDWLIIG